MSVLLAESHITSVVVYARGAVIERRVTLPEALTAERAELEIRGIPAAIEPGSVRAAWILPGSDARSGREILAARARREVPNLPVDREGIFAAVDRARRARDAAVRLRGHLLWRRDLLTSARPTPNVVRKGRPLDPSARFADGLAAIGLLSEETSRIDDRLRALDTEIEALERALAAAILAAEQARAADRAHEAPPELRVTIALGAGAAPEGAALRLTYVTSAAMFWPFYRASFAEGATRVTFSISAWVAQASGEDWRGVRLALSTGDLVRSIALPELPALRWGRAAPPQRRGYRKLPDDLEALFESHDRALARFAETRSPATETLSARALTEAPDPQAYGGAGPQGGGGDADFQMLEEGLMLRALDAPEDLSAPGFAPQPEQQMAAPKKRGGFLAGIAGAVVPARPMAAPPAAGPASLTRAPFQARDARASAPQGMAGRGGGAERAKRDEPSLAEAAANEGTRRIAPGARIGTLSLAAAEPEETAAIEPAERWLDLDALELSAAGVGTRGKLRFAASHDDRGAAALAAIEQISAPNGTIDPLVSRGVFDAVYEARATADVPSSGAPHRVEIDRADGASKTRFIAVPREQAEVFRRAEIVNPFDVPLLAGPVDVLVDGALVRTDAIKQADRGGIVRIGLGVEERLRVARNTRIDEGTAGLLGGTTTIDHHVTTEIASSLGRAVTIDVLDRIPVSDEKDVEVKLTSAKPEPEPYTQADLGHPVRKGLLFKVEVPAGGKAKIEHGYRVTLPSKLEVQGGNRRE